MRVRKNAMRKKLIILNYSYALRQEDAVVYGNKGIGYYSSQKENLIHHILTHFPKLSIDFIGINNKLTLEHMNYPRINYIKLPHIYTNLLQILSYNMLTSLYIIINKKFHPLVLIYSSSESIYYIIPIIITKLLKLPLYMCIRNPPESICAFKQYNWLTAFIIKFLDSIYLRNCSVLIHISEKSKNLFYNQKKIFNKSIVMGSSINNFFLKDNVEICRNYTKVVFFYWGVINKSRDLDTIILAFHKATKENKDFDSDFYLFGGGDDLDRLKELVDKLCIRNIIFKNYKTQDELIKALKRRGAIAVIPIPPDDIYQFSSPLKLAEAICMQMPILASEIEPNKIVKDLNLGILCSHCIDSYSRAFLKFNSMQEDQLKIFQQNSLIAKNYFTPNYIFRELVELMTKDIDNY